MELPPRKRCRTPLWTAAADGLASLPTIQPTVHVPWCNSNEPDLFGDNTAGWNTNGGYLLPDVCDSEIPGTDRILMTPRSPREDPPNNKDGLEKQLASPSLIKCALCENHLERKQMTTDMLVGRTFTHQRTPRKKKRARLPLVEIRILATQRGASLKERMPIRDSTINEFRTVFRLQDVCDLCKYDMENNELPSIETSYRLTTTLLMEVCGAKPKGAAAEEIEQLDDEAWVECFQEQGINFCIPPKSDATQQKYTISDVHSLFHIDSLVDLIVTFVNPLYNVDLGKLFAPATNSAEVESTITYTYKHTNDDFHGSIAI
jgi:hypothetical protein